MFSGAGGLVLHMPPALAFITLDLVKITSPSLILVPSGCIIILTSVLPLGPQAIVTGILIVISLTPV